MSNNKKKEITILLNVYNAQDYVDTFFKSIKNQSFQDFTILVIDDGSTDSTVKKIEEYKSDFNLSIYKRFHEGLQKARKFGVDKAQGDILIILDADLILEKDAVKELLIPFKNDIVGGVTGFLKNKPRNVIEESYGSLREIFFQLKSKGEETDWITGGFCAVKKSVIDQIGGYSSDNSSEDLDISWKMKKFGFKLLQNKKAIAYHRDPTSLKEIWKRDKYTGFREYLLTKTHMKESLKPRRLFRFYPILFPFIIPILLVLCWPLLLFLFIISYLATLIFIKGSLSCKSVSWIVFNVMNFAYCTGFILAFFNKK